MQATILLALINVLLDNGINFSVECGQVTIKTNQNIYTEIYINRKINRWQIVFYTNDDEINDIITFNNDEYTENQAYDKLDNYIQDVM